MKKFNVVMAVLLMVGLIALPVFAAEKDYSKSSMSESKDSGERHAYKMTESKNSAESHTFNLSDLMSKTVKNQRGEELGKIEDVIIGRDGNASFVVLSRGGISGIGSTYVPVPFKTFMSSWTNMMKLDTDKDVIAKLDKATLDSGPIFTNKKDLASSATQDKVCKHYGANACPKI